MEKIEQKIERIQADILSVKYSIGEMNVRFDRYIIHPLYRLLCFYYNIRRPFCFFGIHCWLVRSNVIGSWNAECASCRRMRVIQYRTESDGTRGKKTWQSTRILNYPVKIDELFL